MQYRKLGKWGVKVSEIGLGSWLTYGNSVDAEQSVKLICKAVDLGINFIDTANVYALGRAEEVCGRALRDIPRDDIVLATKVFFPMADGPNDSGLSRKHIFEQCRLSLNRLGTDYIDLYQCHRYDPNVPMEEIIRTMDDLTRRGQILYWGVSEWPSDRIESACKLAKEMNAPPPVSNQPLYNMLHRAIEESVIPVSMREGLGQVVFSPLAQGVLTGKYKPGEPPPNDSRAADDSINMFMSRVLTDENILKVAELSRIANEINLTMSQMALAWILRTEAVSSAIVGARTIEQLVENADASGIKLNDETLSRIDSALSQ